MGITKHSKNGYHFSKETINLFVFFLKFRRVLDVSNINVTQGEIALLLKEFKVDNIPNG